VERIHSVVEEEGREISLKRRRRRINVELEKKHFCLTISELRLPQAPAPS